MHSDPGAITGNLANRLHKLRTKPGRENGLEMLAKWPSDISSINNVFGSAGYAPLRMRKFAVKQPDLPKLRIR